MAVVTKSLGFGVTCATTYEQPYHLARRLSTADHLTNGRVGWNVSVSLKTWNFAKAGPQIVTGYLDSAARNLVDGADQPSHDERYEIAEEYLRVMYVPSELLRNLTFTTTNASQVQTLAIELAR